LSSAILYLAIVAIWAVVLVPRWLRPRAAPPQPVPAESPDADWREPAGPGQDAGVARAVSTDGPGAAGEPADDDVAAGEPADGEATAGADVSEDARGDDVAAGAPETEVAAWPPDTRRAEVLKARRRLLSTLITLTVIAVGLAVTRIDAYWIVIPPTVLLTGYLMLLRQFTHIDAERARRADRIRGAEAGARASQEPVAPRGPVPAAMPATGESDTGSGTPVAPDGAEIIDISGRIGDQVYDQYSDAANRAVGD
jgi:hypothetical protein